MMKLNKEIEHHRKLFKKEVSDNMPVILESKKGVMIVTTTGYDDFEKLMNWMGYMEKDIKWVVTGTYDNPYTKFVLDEGYGKVNTINRYQKAYQNIQVQLSTDNEDIVVIRELVEKNIPKKPIKYPDSYYKSGIIDRIFKQQRLYCCPTCGNACLVRYAPNGRNENNYCYDCGQRLKWSDEND